LRKCLRKTMSRRLAALALALGFAAVACASEPEGDQGDENATDEGALSSTGHGSDEWFYGGPLPQLENPSITASILGHTTHVTGFLPRGATIPALPHVKTKQVGARTQVDVVYPSMEEEVEIVKRGTSALRPVLQKVLSPERILQLQDLVLRVPAADHVVRYAVNLVHATRPAKRDGRHPKSSGGIKVLGSSKEAEAQALVNEYLAYGAGPRASQYLILGAKARAILDGRTVASIDDVKALARPVLQHRLIPNFHAEAEGIRPTYIIERLLESTRA
jgi:hypothetical protein